MALKTVFEYCFNAIEFYPKSNRFVLASRRKSNHFVLKIRLGGFADYIRMKKMADSLFFPVKSEYQNEFHP